MKFDSSILYLTMLILFCTCSKSIDLDPQLTKFHRHTSNGIYLKIPSEFVQKNKPGLFQCGLESSISVKITDKKFEDLKKLYSNGMEFKDVKLPGIERAFFAKSLNHKNQTLNYALVFIRNDSTFYLKAFCPNQLKEKYDSKIEQALHSVAFGKEIDHEEFIKAKELWDRVVFTKDGNYPTQISDMSRIQRMKLGGLSKNAFNDNRGNAIFDKVFAHHGVELSCNNSKKSNLSNIESYECTVEKDDIYYYVNIIFDNSTEATIYICQGKLEKNIDEFKSFIGKVSFAF